MGRIGLNGGTGSAIPQSEIDTWFYPPFEVYFKDKNYNTLMDYYTYAYLRKDGTPYYIGKGKGSRAYRRRKDCINPPKDLSRILILKRDLSEDEAFKHEIYMISVFGRKDIGTGILRNRTSGGEGASGAVPGVETRRKMSEARKGKPRSEETKRKIGDGHRGRVLSEESRRKIGDGNRGKTISVETRTRASNTLKGKVKSSQHRDNISTALTGKKKTKEHKDNMSKAKKGKNTATNSQIWESTADGYRSTAAGVVKHNKFIGADPGARVRIL
jgi:hypothetical protein